MSKSDIKYPFIKISELSPYENNARTHSPEQIEAICNSIREFGFINPVIIDENNMILVGHGRIEAAKVLGLDEAPYRRIENLTEDQKRAYILADNKLSDLGGWDEGLLAQELGEIELDMSLFGFDNVELEDLDFNTDDIEEDEIPEINEDADPKAKRGDIYKLGNHFLMCGDSTSETDVNILIKDIKINMIYTDPPYGMNLNTDFSSMKNKLNFAQEKNIKNGKKYAAGKVDDFNPEMIRVILSIKADEAFLWGADYYSEYIPDKNSGSWFVWDKRSNGGDNIISDESSDKMYGSCFELCWSKIKHKRDIARVKWVGVFGTEQEFDHKRYHPTQKPIKLSRWFIEKYSKEGDKILDLFGGSGSTLLACEQTGRSCHCMELDPHYIDVIIQRWENLTGKKAELIKEG